MKHFIDNGDTWVVQEAPAATTETVRLVAPEQSEYATIHLFHQAPWPKACARTIRVPLAIQTTLSLWLFAAFLLLVVVLMLEAAGFAVSGVLR